MKRIVLMTAVVSVLIVTVKQGFCADPLNLGPEEIVKANGVDIDVGTYSVPSFVDWDSDGLSDLVIGGGNGKVYVYLNVGTKSSPQFLDYFYAQSNGADLYCPPAGCMGCFPRVVYWDMDARKDLLVGQADGTVKIFLNTGTEENPTFDAGTMMTVAYGDKDLDVGARATPVFVDWNNDNQGDLVVGGLDGKVHIYINCGCYGGIPPAFYHTVLPEGVMAQENGTDLLVPTSRSSPVVLDLDGDGKKDLLAGNSEGELLFYSNVGTDADPNFSGYLAVESDGVPIDLGGSAWVRSRPSVCDWTGDNYPDVLIGAQDGYVHLYEGMPFLGDFEPDGDVDAADFAVLAAAWQSSSGHDNWNAACDISDPNDDVIDMLDLEVFTANWLASVK